MLIFDMMNEFIYLCIDFPELPDKTLSLLSCCSPDFLDAFDSLVSSFTSLQRHFFLLQSVKKSFFPFFTKCEKK